jgi:3-phenylpropionate/cinnamic acid dioxygenase small subunit
VSGSAPQDVLHELTQVLFHEAELLDEGRYEEWLGLLADDIRYVAPIQQDLDPDATPVRAEDASAPRHELTYLHETSFSLQMRVAKIRTGMQQTEVPPSRTVRLISNVQVGAGVDADSQIVRSAFILYRQRRQRQVEILAGRRRDRWTQTADGWRLRDREIRFAANVMPTKSMSLFY